jgi:hypothetical protein
VVVGLARSARLVYIFHGLFGKKHAGEVAWAAVLRFPWRSDIMRWIACCLLAGAVGLGISGMLVKHFGSKPSDPNLAQLGLDNNPEELVAPGEPEPVDPPMPAPFIAPMGAYRPMTVPSLDQELPKPSFDQGLKQASYIDSAGAIELENITRQWMPLCPEPGSELARAGSDQRSSSVLDRMPRCDEPTSLQLPSGEEKPR